jgi:hypothetical protein
MDFERLRPRALNQIVAGQRELQALNPENLSAEEERQVRHSEQRGINL